MKINDMKRSEKPTKTKDTSAVLVVCPNCQSFYYIDKKDLGLARPCSICAKEVILKEVKNDGFKATKS
jgi:predicted Zn finger-like uncharacterized protein